jgi:hypothetical protein
MLLVLAHAQLCTACRERLLASPKTVFAGRMLTDTEKEALLRLTETDFFASERLAATAGTSVAEINEYSNHPVARLRHL